MDGASQSATIAAPGQNGSFVFDAVAGNSVGLLTQEDGSLAGHCFNISIVAPDGHTAVYANHTCAPADWSDRLQLSATGRYSVRFDPDGAAAGTGNFTLFSVSPDLDSSNPPGAIPLSAQVPSSGSTQIFFGGTAGQRIALLTQSDVNLARYCFDVQIVNPDGQTQLYRRHACGASDWAAPLTLPTTGTYTIEYYGYAGVTGTVGWMLFHVPTDPSAVLAIGGAESVLETAVPGQRLLATFASAANQRVRLAVEADASLSSECFNVELLKPDGTSLGGERSCGLTYLSAQQSLPVAGTYSVVVSSIGTATGTAKLGVLGP